MDDLIGNAYMNEYVEMLKTKDVQQFLDDKKTHKKPNFKNFLNNNANLKRTEKQLKLKQDFLNKQNRELEIQENIRTSTVEDVKHMNYNPEALSKNKPLRSVNRLIHQYSSAKKRNGAPSEPLT
jgi:hypothetical protein